VTYNTKVVEALSRAGARHGIASIGTYFDCTSRETKFVVPTIVKWLRNSALERIPGLEEHIDRILAVRGPLAGLDAHVISCDIM